MNKFHKFEYVGSEMENIRHKKYTFEEKNIIPLKMASENTFKKCGFHLYKSLIKFKIQQKVLNKIDMELYI